MEEVYKVIDFSRLGPAKPLLLLIFYRPVALVRFYGGGGLVYYFFGSQMTWRTEAKVLGTLLDDDANHFKKSVQDECAIISVAAAIVAQIAITGLGFAELSRTHWVARALFLFSVLASLMAVYYATTQQRIIGRLHQPEQIRGWIRGRLPLSGQRLGARRQGDPQHHEPTSRDSRQVVRELAQRCFCPSVTSVLTVSAPQILLSSSLHSLLLGLGVYFGFVWTHVVDKDAGHSDSRNIMIVYLVSILACFAVYTVSQLLQDDEWRLELAIAVEYAEKFLRHPYHPAHQSSAADLGRDDRQQSEGNP